MLDYSKLPPLAAAFGRFSGGTVIPDLRHDTWQRLANVLSEYDVDPNEYAYWLVFVQQSGTPGGFVPWDFAILDKRNMVCSMSLVERFLEWRSMHAERVSGIVRGQREYVRTLLSASRPLLGILSDEAEAVGAAVRCELALESLPPEECRQILTRFGHGARMVLLGIPAYRTECPKTYALLQQESAQKRKGGPHA